MARTIRVKTTHHQIPQMISTAIRGVPEDIQKVIIRTIFPDMQRDMKEKIGTFGKGFGLSDNPVSERFEYTQSAKKGGVLKFQNKSPHVNALITGVKEHGPVYVGGWTKAVGFKDKLGNYPEFIYVGGADSRIKKNTSQRDFWNPVINKYFGNNGTAMKLIMNEISNGLRKRLK